MEKIITFENLSSFAYCNHAICKRPIRGIAISFFGLGAMLMYDEHTWEGEHLAQEGILYLVPYQNPWAWMNMQTVAYTEELLDVLFHALEFSSDTPVISTGGSMGGLSALTYMAYAKRVPVACVANCPVCDLPYHFTERPDLPRTIYSAFFGYSGTMEEAMRSASPLHLVDKMPRSAEYHIFHCTADAAVNIQMHSDRFVDAMRKEHNVQYYVVPERSHCDLTPEMYGTYISCIIDAVNKNKQEG